MKKTILLLFLLVAQGMICPARCATDTIITVIGGDGGNYSSKRMPFGWGAGAGENLVVSYGTQTIYLASELTDLVGMTIDSMWFHMTSRNSFFRSDSYLIVSLSYVNSSTVYSAIDESSAVVVYQGPLIAAVDNGIPFDTPFLYTGGNLLVSVKASIRKIHSYDDSPECNFKTSFRSGGSRAFHCNSTLTEYLSNRLNLDDQYFDGNGYIPWISFHAKDSLSIVGNVCPLSLGKGDVLGSDTVRGLDTVNLLAVPNYGYHFLQWDDSNTNNPRTIIATQDESYCATFMENQYSINTMVANEQLGNVSSGGIYDYMSNVIISATPVYGYHFTAWNDGNTDNPRTIVLTQDTVFTAYFDTNQYTINGMANYVERGTVLGSATVNYLDSVLLTASANYGYHFQRWNDNIGENPRIVVAIDNINLMAIFDYNQYIITMSVDTTIHGTCTGGGSYNYLSNRTIQANANYGYHFTHWNDGVIDNPRIITLTQDTSFTAFFDINQYVVTGESNNSERGTVTGSDTVYYLDTVVLTATAYYGYHFQRWNDYNTDNPRAVIVTGDITKTAIFTYNQYTITLNVDAWIHGTCTGDGSYNYLSSRIIQANANYGYHFTHWNDGVTDNPRTISLTQDTVFIAYFAPNQYTLTMNAGEHGSVTGSGTYNYGDTITIQAFPDDHYHFVRWSDGSYENPRRYRITGDITLGASFAINTYTVNVVSSDILRGSVESSGTQFVYGTPCTVTATAYSGYTFAGWSNGATYNPYTFAVISDVELTALFITEGEEIYTITVVSANPTMGNVSGGGQALSGGTLTIRATPNDGYRFVRWNDNDTNAVRTVTVTANATYTAYFENDPFGIADIDVTQIKVYATEGRIMVLGAEGVDVRVYDMMGRQVAYSNADDEHDIPVPLAGVYLVKVGTLPARKVVVIR